MVGDRFVAGFSSGMNPAIERFMKGYLEAMKKKKVFGDEAWSD